MNSEEKMRESFQRMVDISMPTCGNSSEEFLREQQKEVKFAHKLGEKEAETEIIHKYPVFVPTILFEMISDLNWTK